MPCCQDLLKLHLRLWKLRRLKRSCNKPGYLQLDLEVKTSCRTSSSFILCIPLLSFDCHGVCYSAIHCAKICQVSTGLGYHSESRTDVQPLAYSKRRIEIAEDVCLQTCFAQRSNSQRSQPPSHSVAEFAAATATLQRDYLSRDHSPNSISELRIQLCFRVTQKTKTTILIYTLLFVIQMSSKCSFKIPKIWSQDFKRSITPNLGLCRTGFCSTPAAARQRSRRKKM